MEARLCVKRHHLAAQQQIIFDPSASSFFFGISFTLKANSKLHIFYCKSFWGVVNCEQDCYFLTFVNFAKFCLVIKWIIWRNGATISNIWTILSNIYVLLLALFPFFFNLLLHESLILWILFLLSIKEFVFVVIVECIHIIERHKIVSKPRPRHSLELAWQKCLKIPILIIHIYIYKA